MLQPFIMKDKNDQYVCLFLKPEEGNIVDKITLDTLVPIIKNLGQNQTSFKAYLDNILTEDNELVFSDVIDKNIMEEIRYLCHQKISERLIVPQDMGTGPPIRHRPLYFGLGKRNNSLVVKYTKLGEFNSIDVVLNLLKNLGISDILL